MACAQTAERTDSFRVRGNDGHAAQSILIFFRTINHFDVERRRFDHQAHGSICPVIRGVSPTDTIVRGEGFRKFERVSSSASGNPKIEVEDRIQELTAWRKSLHCDESWG